MCLAYDACHISQIFWGKDIHVLLTNPGRKEALKKYFN